MKFATSRSHLLVPIHAATNKVETEDKRVCQPLPVLAHPEPAENTWFCLFCPIQIRPGTVCNGQTCIFSPDGKVPDGEDPVYIDLEVLRVQPIGFASLDLQKRHQSPPFVLTFLRHLPDV